MKLIDRFLNWLGQDKNEKIIQLLKEKEESRISIENLKKEKANLVQGILETEEDFTALENTYKELKATIEPHPLETFWNNKRPKSENYTYVARPAIGRVDNIAVDPRIFFVNDNALPVIKGISNDDIAWKCLKYVIYNIVYTSDTTQFKDPEVWMFPFESLALKKGDCEDGAILLANLMLKSGIPYWRIRLNAGDVEGGGHCWVTYLSESDNEWYILDWCYWPTDSQKGLTWNKAEKYFDIWFSFNEKFVFVDDKLDRQ